MIAMENKVSKQGLPLTNEWGIEDVEWAKGSELGFIQPEKEIAGNHVAGEIGGEPGEEEVVGLNSTGEREVVLTISTRLYEDFTKIMQALTTEDAEQVEMFVASDVYNFLKEQPGASEEDEEESFEEKVDLKLLPKKSFKIMDKTDDKMTFELFVQVSWG